MSIRAFAVVGLATLLGTSAGRVTAQSSTARATLSADTVQLGEVFELEVRLLVPAGSVVYFPDSLARAPVLESFAPVEWRAEAAPERGATLTLTYPLIAFGAGTVPVPGLDVVTRPAAARTRGETLPGGSVVGDWSEAPRGAGATLFTSRIPRREVWVEPVFTVDDFARGVEPMPPDDVVGASWHWPSLALLLLFSTVLGSVVVTTTRGWLAARPPLPAQVESLGPMTREEARRWALRELDRLLATGPHTEERSHRLYGESSGIVRRYVQRWSPEWGPDLTSHELMSRLQANPNAQADESLLQEMHTAEVVKFGRLRPDPLAAEQHLRALRTWVSASGEAAA